MLIFILLFSITKTLCYSGPNITFGNSTLQGTNITVLNDSMTEYLGVPYARPPIAYYRFEPPIELNDTLYWNGTYPAIHLADACPQIIRMMNFSGYDDANPKNTSESCLKFNMWVPKANDDEKMPVIVFFHGGSWTVRTASVDKFNGSVLALKTKSIVIAANFRLGFLGFAYLEGSSQIRGNMGLLDQQAMLKWINKNIDKFGGDKTNVTIFGTSSGASSVAAHLFSNGSKPYFNRGIMSSGTITHFMSTVSTKIADTNTRNVSRLVNCTQHTNGTNFTVEEIATCLKNITNVTLLLEAARTVKADGQFPTPFPFMPIDNDTVFFNGSIKKMYSEGSFNKEVDLMMGRTGDEATFFMATGFTNNSRYNCRFYPQKNATDPDNACNMNETNFVNLVSFGSTILHFNETENNTLIQIYNNSAATYTNRSIRILSDFIFDCELSRFANIYANGTNKNVYLYEYARRSPINIWPNWTGAMHGDDLIDIFGIPFRHPEKYKINDEKEEQKLSEQVMWTIGNFSKYGNTTSKWEKTKPSNLTAFIFNGTDSFNSPTNKNFTPPTCIEFSKLMQNYMTRIKKMIEEMKKKKEEDKEKEKKKE
uniref:Carboxylic ester hydrolase n=1 Tax=Strongyloides papillosus TaxID=174720 RepID=A0A0N5BIU5_STREA